MVSQFALTQILRAIDHLSFETHSHNNYAHRLLVCFCMFLLPACVVVLRVCLLDEPSVPFELSGRCSDCSGQPTRRHTHFCFGKRCKANSTAATANTTPTKQTCTPEYDGDACMVWGASGGVALFPPKFETVCAENALCCVASNTNSSTLHTHQPTLLLLLYLRCPLSLLPL
jgi:hypothetical protein